MSNQLSDLLAAWQSDSSGTQWVLGTVYKTEGSAYRKAGALMLINGFGQQFGLLSGGCLESDILRNARRVMLSGKAMTLVYDGSDEDDLSFRLGIGCGGKVYIMLQLISADNDLGLQALATALKRRQPGTYYQKIGGNQAYFKVGEHRPPQRSQIKDGWLVTPIRPEPHLLVIGGGIDARPLVGMAKLMGWQVTLADPRPANARAEHFPEADHVLRDCDNLSAIVADTSVDAAVLMSHSIALDAHALGQLHNAGLKHIALLGPRHRFAQVLGRAGLKESELRCRVSGPAGLPIGGQLPESIALSILAECHAVLHQHTLQPELRVAVAQ
ncbi:Xanthine and CO dehydrogenase maturation factor, XdhC/CoxF family [Marinobacterium lacunae]|uniref:Xanthine and CO dehydrogenase maturation factor, XdhC/CoxF family n=1 Tax=Marinobacterium lacunae TaxID=1232683 RepID=A0A081FV94_9GAMM|nr:XdhC/CoxI family protein [Marinobacterium lacunae]KEA62449.1 Xanthine and CO dehydrogenase maturation factor, XdhC/CoxF family [Marinobacterium lacunae]